MSASDDLAQRGIDNWEPSMSAGKEYISDIVRLPGMWEPDEGCVELRPTGFCEQGHVQIGSLDDCGTRQCEMHWYQWRRGSTESVVARLAAYRYVQEGIGRRMLHVVSSPEQEQRWTLNRLWSETREYDLLKEHGGRGGVCIPHAYSTTDEAKSLFASAVEQGYPPERGIWRFIRESSDGWEQVRPLIEVAPHAHHLVSWRDLDGDELAEEVPGEWVIHNVRSLAPFYLYEEEVPGYRLIDDNGRIERSRDEIVREGFEDMARLSMYLLSHAPVQPEIGDEISRRNSVTYWGAVHPNAFNPEEELEASEWERIQRLAAEAVGKDVDEEGEGESEEQCHVEDCDSFVHRLHELTDFLAEPSWIEGLEYEQACEMWGLKVWAQDGLSPGGAMDRPPPGGFERSGRAPDEIVRDAEGFREWLRRLGRSRIQQNPWYDIQAPT